MIVEIYSTKRPFMRRQWRWRAIANNGHIMATSGEGYNNRADMLDALDTVSHELRDAPLEGELV